MATNDLQLPTNGTTNDGRSPRSGRRETLTKGEIGSPTLLDAEEIGPMPDKDELDRQFRELMESMNVSTEHEEDLLAMTDERKWKLIKNDRERRILNSLPAEYFVTQLRRHLDPELRGKKAKKAKMKGLEPSSDILRKLEVALRTNKPTWIEEFVDHPNNGHVVLMDFLDDLPQAAHAAKSGAARIQQRIPGEHHLCLLCVKALMRQDYGFRKIVNEEGFLNIVALSLRNENVRTRVLSMQMLAMAARDPSGGALTALDAIHHLSVVAQERTRFETIVDFLDEKECPVDFSVSALTFFNTVVDHAEDLNMLVYLQMDLERAGLLDVLEKLKEHPDASIRKLVSDYDAKVVNVDSIVQSREENFQLYHEAVDQVNAMQETLESVTQQRNELRQLHKDAQLQATELQAIVAAAKKENDNLSRKLDDTMGMFIEQQELVRLTEDQLRETEERHAFAAEQLVKQQQQIAALRTGGNVITPGQVEGIVNNAVGGAAAAAMPAAPEPAGPPDLAKMGITEVEEAVDVPPAPPLPPPPGSAVPPPPPAPPIPGGNGVIPPPPLSSGMYAPPGMKPKRRITPRVPVPMLNWVPLRKINDTIFAQLDDENVLAEMDFSEFEREFQVRNISKKLEVKDKKKKERITTIESNRARNLVITCRRIDMDYDALRETIIGTDLVGLPAEHAELLLNYVPTDEEVAGLEKHGHHKERLAEAERFMYEMLKVERYESRLRVMAYIGYFDELYLTVQPQIDAVLEASECLINSMAFHKLLEIVLAFGNYMNSAKRGPAYGFKLPTFERLLDTKSTDRRQTLMHFIAHTVTKHYPQVTGWTEELQSLPQAARVSMVTLMTDIQGLRKGIDLILYEREKQQQNFVVYSFYSNAVHKVARINEKFKMMTDKYDKVCVLFNENPKTLEPFDFFSVFDRLVKAYNKCLEENTKRAVADGDLVVTVVNGVERKVVKGGARQEVVHPLLNVRSKRRDA